MSNRAVYTITSELYRQNRQALDDWVNAHMVDHRRVPVESKIVIDNGQVTFESFVRRDGRVVLEGHGDAAEPKRTTITVPLVRPFPLLMQASQ